jgi:uncharacterized protein YacL
MNNNNFKTYFFSFLAFLLVFTISLEIYLPIYLNTTTEKITGMFFFNFIVMIFLHHYCDRDNLKYFDLKETYHKVETKIIFYSQFVIIIHLLLYVLASIFFTTNRDGFIDLIILLLIQIYLFTRGNDYLNFEK